MNQGRLKSRHQKKWLVSYDDDLGEESRTSGILSLFLGSVVCTATFSVMLLIAD